MKIYYINGHESAQVKVIVEDTGAVNLICDGSDYS